MNEFISFISNNFIYSCSVIYFRLFGQYFHLRALLEPGARQLTRKWFWDESDCDRSPYLNLAVDCGRRL